MHAYIDFKIVDQHTGGKWLIHSTKQHKNNPLQSLEFPVEYPSRESEHRMRDSEGNMFNPIFKGNVQGLKHPGGGTFIEPELLSYRRPQYVVQNKKNGHNNPKNSHNYNAEIELY